MAANPSTWLDAPDLTRLDMASVVVREWLDTPCLVGSCLARPDYRDVDVRCILDDKRYDALFPGAPWPHGHPLRHLIEATVSQHYVMATGLRVDFQIQRRTQANIKYPALRRHPLGIYPRWSKKQVAAAYTPQPAPADHDCGHEWVVSVASRLHSSGVAGEDPPVHSDANWWSEDGSVTVRASDLPTALAKVAALPLSVWATEGGEPR